MTNDQRKSVINTIGEDKKLSITKINEGAYKIECHIPIVNTSIIINTYYIDEENGKILGMDSDTTQGQSITDVERKYIPTTKELVMLCDKDLLIKACRLKRKLGKIFAYLKDKP